MSLGLNYHGLYFGWRNFDALYEILKLWCSWQISCYACPSSSLFVDRSCYYVRPDAVDFLEAYLKYLGVFGCTFAKFVLKDHVRLHRLIPWPLVRILSLQMRW